MIGRLAGLSSWGQIEKVFMMKKLLVIALVALCFSLSFQVMAGEETPNTPSGSGGSTTGGSTDNNGNDNTDQGDENTNENSDKNDVVVEDGVLIFTDKNGKKAYFFDDLYIEADKPDDNDGNANDGPGVDPGPSQPRMPK